jgi:hypothetical protein
VNVLVLTVEDFTGSLKVAVIAEVTETAVAASAGDVLVTEGGTIVVNDQVLGEAKLTPFVSWTSVLMIAL